MGNIDWKKAKEYLDALEQAYREIGSAGVFGRMFGIWPLRERLESGERTRELYDAIMKAE